VLSLCVFVSFDDDEEKKTEEKKTEEKKTETKITEDQKETNEEEELKGVPLYINMSENPKKAKWILAFGKLFN